MLPDAKWLDALSLPLKAKLSVCLASGILLYLFQTRVLIIAPLEPYLNTGLLIALVVFGALLLVDAGEWLAKPLTEKRRASLLTFRRAVRAKEDAEKNAASKRAALARLDHLSREEIRYVAQALEKGTPTFYTYVHAGAVTMLQGKGLVWTPGGTHHQDYYPFSFYDFVWDELLTRRDEFLSKEAAHKEADPDPRRRTRL